MAEPRRTSILLVSLTLTPLLGVVAGCSLECDAPDTLTFESAEAHSPEFETRQTALGDIEPLPQFPHGAWIEDATQSGEGGSGGAGGSNGATEQEGFYSLGIQGSIPSAALTLDTETMTVERSYETQTGETVIETWTAHRTWDEDESALCVTERRERYELALADVQNAHGEDLSHAPYAGFEVQLSLSVRGDRSESRAAEAYSFDAERRKGGNEGDEAAAVSSHQELYPVR